MYLNINKNSECLINITEEELAGNKIWSEIILHSYNIFIYINYICNWLCKYRKAPQGDLPRIQPNENSQKNIYLILFSLKGM